MNALGELLAEAEFPLYGVPRALWPGPAFVGDVVRASGVRAVQLVYVDDAEESGLLVSTLDPAHAAEDALAAHLTAFVARFDPEPLVRRARKRSPVLFPKADFVARDVVLSIDGTNAGASLYSHRTWPLQLMRTALRRGAALCDVGIATWRLDVSPWAAKVRRVDLGFAKDFDARAEPAYPPPEMLEGDD